MPLSDLVYCDRRIHNDRTNRSASSQHCACPSYSSCAGFFGKASHHSGLSAPLQPRFGSLQPLAFPKTKIAAEMEEICECDGHAAHKISQWRLTADWLSPRKSDYSRMHNKVSSYWLPSYIKATWPGLEIFKMAGYFPDSPRIWPLVKGVTNKNFYQSNVVIWPIGNGQVKECPLKNDSS